MEFINNCFGRMCLDFETAEKNSKIEQKKLDLEINTLEK